MWDHDLGLGVGNGVPRLTHQGTKSVHQIESPRARLSVRIAKPQASIARGFAISRESYRPSHNPKFLVLTPSPAAGYGA